MKRNALGFLAGLIVIAVGFIVGRCEAAAIDLTLQPSAATVGVGDPFTVSVAVNPHGNEYNTYTMKIGWTSAASLDGQEETSFFPSYCGNTFWSVSGTNPRQVDHAILCANTYVIAVGTPWIWHFVAAQAGTATLTPSAVHFYRAGIEVAAGTLTGASVTVTSNGGGGHGLDKPQQTADWGTVKRLYD